MTAGACGSPWWEGLGVGQVCGAPALAPQPCPDAGEGEVTPGGCPGASRQPCHPCPTQRAPSQRCRGAAGPDQPVHSSCPAPGSLIPEMSWSSCLPQTWRCPGLAAAPRSPMTREPGACPPEPRRAHKPRSPGHALLQSRGQPLLGQSPCRWPCQGWSQSQGWGTPEQQGGLRRVATVFAARGKPGEGSQLGKADGEPVPPCPPHRWRLSQLPRAVGMRGTPGAVGRGHG